MEQRTWTASSTIQLKLCNFPRIKGTEEGRPTIMMQHQSPKSKGKLIEIKQLPQLFCAVINTSGLSYDYLRVVIEHGSI